MVVVDAVLVQSRAAQSRDEALALLDEPRGVLVACAPSDRRCAFLPRPWLVATWAAGTACCTMHVLVGLPWQGKKGRQAGGRGEAC